MLRVFISSTTSDTDQVKVLASELRNLQMEVWPDFRRLASGDEFNQSIRETLRNSNAVLVVLSRTSVSSPWVNAELGAAEALGKKIIPVIVGDGLRSEDIPDMLRSHQWLDARKKAPAEVAREIEQLVQAA